MATRATLTPARRAVAAALLFLGSATVAGIYLTGEGVRYRTFGVPEGTFALLLAYVLVLRHVWPAPEGVIGWLPVAYGTLATAQVLELLFPPPGVIEWVVVTGVAVHAWGTVGVATRHQLVMRLASLAVLLALLRFSVLPVLWGSTEAQTGLLGLENPVTSARRWIFSFDPITPAGEGLAFVALCLWALATRVVWPSEATPASLPGDRPHPALPGSPPLQLHPPETPPPHS